MTAPIPVRRPARRRQHGGIVWKLLAALLAVAVLLAAGGIYLNLRGEAPVDGTVPPAGPPDAAQVERGRYLAVVGNCAGCHTASPEAPYAGGRALPTPFGTVYSTNLTPDTTHGIGDWSQAHFWRAMHHGRARDGRLLNPVFPYASYTHVTREDSDAIYAYLRSLPPVAQPDRPHALRFPYNTQLALGVWRALFFRAADPAVPVVQAAGREKDAAWQRGAYLARGLGHCIECHSPRNALGAVGGAVELAGGAIPAQGWYAPSLADDHEAGVARWKPKDVVRLLQTGQGPGATVSGPMAEVVYGSTQHWSETDLRALAVFLQALPAAPARAPREVPPAQPAVLAQGGRIYEQQCAQCHGDAGQGAPGAYPALAGNRAVVMEPIQNLVSIVHGGGFAPATAGNPRPWGMPPFAHLLTDAETAAVLTYIRQSWGNRAPAVSELQVLRHGRGE